MRISTVGAFFLAAFFVAGCGGGGGGETNRTDATFAVEGRVLNGVLAGSTVQALGAGDGSALGTATTDSEGRYIFEVPREGPYRLRATGGQLNAVEYSGTLEAFCPVGSDCFVTPYTTVLLRLVDHHGFNHGDATALMASRLGFDGDPFAGNAPVVDFDLDAARAAIAGGDGLAEWVVSIVAWATSEDAEPPPGVSGSGPVEPPAPPVDPDPVPTPAPDPDPEPTPDPDPGPIAPVTYPVSATAGAGGSISPTSQTIEQGATATFEVTPLTGYGIVTVSGCSGSLDGDTYITGAITEACTVSSAFALVQYTLTYAAGPNGSLDGETAQTVSHGASGSAVTAIPATGYSFVAWTDSSTANPRADSNVTGDIGVTANFTLDTAPVGPTAVGSCGTTPQDMQYTNTLTATDIDPSSYPTFTLDDGSLGPLITPKGGEVIITDTTTGDFVYKPGPARGLDAFQFKVTNTAGEASTAIETVVVDQAVMPLGDSITSGYISISENPPNSLRVGYREELQKMLKASGIAFDFVGTVSHGWDVPNFDFNHQGHGGWSAAQIAWGRTGFPQDGVRAWLDRNPADFILLHVGTNGLDPSNSIDVAAILDEIDLWKTNAFTKNVKVIVALIIDRYPNDFRVSLFNDNVQNMVEERIVEGATIALVDHQKVLIYPDDLADELHPNEVGYKKMAAVWFDKLAPMMDRCP